MATYSMEGSGATVGILYIGSLVMPQKPGYDQFPPVPNGWGMKHHVPDKVPPLLAKDEGPPTKKRTRPENNPYRSSLPPR
jgi:hypothetical protein